MSGRVAAYSWTHIFWPSGFDLQWPWLHSPALRSSFQRPCRHPHPCFSHVATPWKLHIQNSAASLSWPHHPPPAWPPSPKDLPHHLQSPSQCCLPSHLLHHHAQPSFSDEHPQSTNSFKVYPIKITILIILYVNFQKNWTFFKSAILEASKHLCRWFVKTVFRFDWFIKCLHLTSDWNFTWKPFFRAVWVEGKDGETNGHSYM